MASRHVGVRLLGCGCLLAAICIAAGPVILMGPLDSQRRILSRASSPDGRWIAQLERLTVGGAPNIVVTLRRSWQPNWYLTSCKAVSYYGDTRAVLRWEAPTRLAVIAEGNSGWNNHAPFRWEGPFSAPPGCSPVHVEVH